MGGWTTSEERSILNIFFHRQGILPGFNLVGFRSVVIRRNLPLISIPGNMNYVTGDEWNTLASSL